MVNETNPLKNLGKIIQKRSHHIIVELLQSSHSFSFIYFSSFSLSDIFARKYSSLCEKTDIKTKNLYSFLKLYLSLKHYSLWHKYALTHLLGHGNDLFLADRVICGVAVVIVPGGVVFANHAVLAIPIAGLTLCPLHIVPGRPVSPNPLSLCKRKTVGSADFETESDISVWNYTVNCNYIWTSKKRRNLFLFNAELG